MSGLLITSAILLDWTGIITVFPVSVVSLLSSLDESSFPEFTEMLTADFPVSGSSLNSSSDESDLQMSVVLITLTILSVWTGIITVFPVSVASLLSSLD